MRFPRTDRKALLVAGLIAFVQAGWSPAAGAAGESKEKNTSESRDGSRSGSTQAKENEKQKEPKIETVELRFKKGETELSESARKELHRELAKLPKDAKVKRVRVAVWPDKDFPTEGGMEKEDQKIVKERTENIEKLLESQDQVGSVSTFGFKELQAIHMRMGDEEMRSRFGKRTDDMTTKKEMQMIRKVGGPSKGVVIFEIERQKEREQGKDE